MKSTLSLFIIFFAFVFSIDATLSAQSEIQIRIVGGPLVDEGNAVIPLSSSTYVVGSTSSHAAGTVRGYVVNYDSDFQFAWSLLTPYGSPVEQIVDAWDYVPSGTGDLTVLSKRLGENDSYNVVLHTIKNMGDEGEIVNTTEVVHPLNQDPVSAINWRGSRWAVGNVDGDGWLLNVDDAQSIQAASYITWGHPVISESVNSARVFGDTLFVAGTSDIDGVLQSTVWVWDSEGNPLWARISPDTETIGENVANDIAIGPEGIRLLYSFEREELPLGHGVISLDIDDGTPGAPVNTSGDVFVEGCKMVWAGDQLVKLAQIDFENDTETDLVITRLGTYGGYVSSGILGTDFVEEPKDLTIDEQGRIWVLGTTHGYLNGSASICIYRLDSIDVIPNISSISPSLGIKDDPVFLNSVGMSNPLSLINDCSLFPNPCSSISRVTISGLEQGVGNIEEVVWSIYSMKGELLLEGASNIIDCDGLSDGSYVVWISSKTKESRLPLQIIN